MSLEINFLSPELLLSLLKENDNNTLGRKCLFIISNIIFIIGMIKELTALGRSSGSRP